MSSEDIIELLVLVSCAASFLLSIVVAFWKLPKIHRIFPIIWQIIFLYLILVPSLHLGPKVYFNFFVLAVFWSALAFISSHFLYRQSVSISKMLAFSQVVQGVGFVCLSAFYYISSCWRVFGRIVWNP